MMFSTSRRPAGKLTARCGLARLLVHVFILSAVGLAGAAGAEKPLVWVACDVCKVNPISANVLEEHYFWDSGELARTRAMGDEWWYYAQDGDTSRYDSQAARKRSLGYNGPIPSMRLKQLRRGSQDYEYLALLTRLHKGDRAKADAIMARHYLLKGNYRGVIGRTKVSAADTCKLRADVTAAILAALHR